jgi:hypothetical protein
MASFSGHKIITDLRRGFFPLVKLMKNLWVCFLHFDVNHCQCFRVAGLSTDVSCTGGAAVIANLLPFWTDIDKHNEL